jgi:hypothetical protein
LVLLAQVAAPHCPLLVAVVATAEATIQDADNTGVVAATRGQLVDLLERLRGPAARNPDAPDELRERRAARWLAAASGTDERGGKNGEEDGSHAVSPITTTAAPLTRERSTEPPKAATRRDQRRR